MLSFYQQIVVPVSMALIVGNVASQELAPHDVAQALARMADRWYPSLKARVDGPAIFVGTHRLVVTPILENSGKQEARWGAGVRFEIAVDGRSNPSLTLGAVGTDTTRVGALRMAVVSYAASVGVALLGAFADPAAGYSVGEYRAHPGITVDRGLSSPDLVAASSREALARLLAALEPTVVSYARDSITALSVLVEVDTTGVISGECWLGGRRIDSALPALYGLAWPRTGKSYLHKVTYVLVRQR